MRTGRSTGSRSVTIGDVAAKAGVSLSTVSRVMNGNGTVDTDLAERVLEASKALNYSASPLARSLVLGKTFTVAFVLPDLANPTFQGALRGVSRAAAKDGYRVLIADTGEVVSEESILALETRRRCDAVILCAPRMSEERLRELLPQLEPAVLINRDVLGTSAPVAAADYRSGIVELLMHLVGLGHRRVTFLAGAHNSASNRHRQLGIEEVVRAHPDLVVTEVACGVTFADGHGAAAAVAASDATAVMAFNDLVAMGLLSGLGEAGVRVPEQLSVAGFDDIPFAQYTTPPLTTVSVPVTELGEQAWLRLRALLDGEAPDHNVYFRPRLEVRGSTAAPQAVDA
ncbi:LacI family DNA-binding transcriptional regulator [Plantibacter sp. ME-Dv--P-122b]|uniref:LacI family DNA-binding transcriptional regulator n=1 Tax=Plantibacter sp. ME-Dv--P-122b TaxID=3040300 RepID=UPI00254B2B45|nr:LacI family DNA-binding transcriptional regulator [Plantibacter sp. ME-Dv--P-122b]